MRGSVGDAGSNGVAPASTDAGVASASLAAESTARMRRLFLPEGGSLKAWGHSSMTAICTGMAGPGQAAPRASLHGRGVFRRREEDDGGGGGPIGQRAEARGRQRDAVR